MAESITLQVNGQAHRVEVDPETPLLYVLRGDLGLKGPKYGCGLEQCNTCKVLIDGADVPSCQLPVHQAAGTEITTLEGLGTAETLHPLQECFLEEQAAQCGYCTAGLIIAAQGLLNRTRYPSDSEIREALADNLCRCGTHERVRRAIKLRIGRPEMEPIWSVIEAAAVADADLSPGANNSSGQTPDLDAWIRINADETVTVFSGKVEIGQGLKTALAQIAAEELDVDFERIQLVTADTAETPDEGVTAGSMSMQMSGGAIRMASAEARQILLDMAFEHLEAETPAAELRVKDGVISDPATGKQVSYWTLMGGQRFGRQISGQATPKTADQYRIVGQAQKRVDLLAKVTGQPAFVQDLNLPGMCYARVVRPPNYHARLDSLDETAVRQMPGVVTVVRDGSFLAVVAEREDQAIRAADALREVAVWSQRETPFSGDIYVQLRQTPGESALIVDGSGTEDIIPPIQAPENAAQTLTATFKRPFTMHGSLGPSAAAALWDADAAHLTVWSHTQGPYVLQGAIAQVLGLDTDKLRVIHAEGAGCYGHNAADDVGLDAALIARAVPGRPVLLQWSRDDEHAWEPYGSAMLIETQASLDAEGQIIDWNYDVWSYIHSTRPRQQEGRQSGLLASWHLEQPFTPPPARLVSGRHFGSHRNADPKYSFPKRVVKHFVPDQPIRVSALRSLGAFANIFSIESFMDELAQAAGTDPVDFRLRHLDDDRAKAVIRAAAEQSGWGSDRAADHGRGIAFAQYKNIQCYAAIVVDLHVERESGAIHLDKVVIAADAGQIINPDGLSNQLEGGMLQAASWTLFEAVTYDETGITSRDWETYPILRFPDAPKIETLLLNRPGLPFLGSGEASQNPTPAAIANAVYDAVGVRLRELPLTPERLKAALRA